MLDLDERHDRIHTATEDEIRTALNRFRVEERGCRIAALLVVVAEEFLAMDSVTDIDDVMEAFHALMDLRVDISSDLFQTEGSA